MLAQDYAKAIYHLTHKSNVHDPQVRLVGRVQRVLERRGHLRLFPRILEECRKLAERDERRALRAIETPEQAQTRLLLDLYRKLTA